MTDLTHFTHYTFLTMFDQSIMEKKWRTRERVDDTEKKVKYTNIETGEIKIIANPMETYRKRETAKMEKLAWVKKWTFAVDF